ncbi:putative ABC transport system permease protein [Palleronia salina]|uniref:Putative ABC transport system permease protein n=1 Tax=Palleronia salina TaxID=313368 RepID=A0A1M6L356_9RHOB|nr:FtsX-like permease family protein [Palleronia salina]SHJ65499.1 putative ABC transport system permease protein [Palleronia salina]
MIRAGLTALLSHWIRRPFQLVTLMLGLATATALWSGVQAINAEARASYDRAARALAGPDRDTLVARDGGAIDQAVFVTLRRAGWQVSPLIEGRVPSPSGPLRVIGIDGFTLPSGDLPVTDTSEPGDVNMAFLTPPGLLLVAPGTQERLSNADDLPPRQTAEGIPPGVAYADIGIAQTLLGREGQIDRLVVTGPPSLTAPPLDEVAPALARRSAGGGNDIARLTDSFHLNLTAFGLLSFAVGLFIVRGAIGLAFEQRRGVFRTLRALGMPARTLLALLTAELLVLALVAGLIGVALGYLVASLLLPDVAATLRGLYGASVDGTLSLRPAWWLSGLAIATLGTAAAAAGSLWKVAHLPLLAPAQPRAWARASDRAMRLQAVAAVALLILALVLGVTGGGLVVGFTLLGALLVGAALALPIVLHSVLGLFGRGATGPLSEWFWADTRQQLPGLSLALMALLLALAANIGVGTMVSSFRTTFTGWLDQRLASELYLTAESEAQAEDLRAWLATRADAVLPIRSSEAQLAGAPAEVFGVADHATYRDNWPLIEADAAVWDRVAAGEAVLVNEQLARREGLWPGATLDVPGWADAPVAGVYSDYGNPLGQAMVGLDRFDALFPEAPRLRFGLRTDRPEALRTALIDEFGLSGANVTDQASIKQFSLDVFERTFTVTAALNVLTLSVAALAILTSLLTLATMRQPQLAPVWALGLTRRRLARLELLRALLLAALTFVVAVPVGLVLAWVLLSVINVEAFGWRLPMELFPRDWVWLGVLSLLAAGLASLLPAIKLARTPPNELLKVFAHER